MRRPMLAAFLSALSPGLGQFYNRHWLKGLGFLIGAMILSTMAADQISVEALMAGDSSGAWKALALLVILLGFLIWSIVDAYGSAKARPTQG